MSLFPSTRTDYLDMNELYPPLTDVHVRRAISYAIDRAAIVKSVLFGYGTPANSFLPPQVPFYDKNAGGLQYNIAKAKAEMAKSKYPKGFKVQMLVGAGAQVESTIGQILQSAAEAARHQRRPSSRRTRAPSSTTSRRASTSSAFSYWTMDIADPDELVTFARRSEGRRVLVLHATTTTRRVTKLSHQAQRETNPAKRAAALRADPDDRRARRVPRLPLLLAVPLRVHEQAARLLRLAARQLPPGGRLARLSRVGHGGEEDVSLTGYVARRLLAAGADRARRHDPRLLPDPPRAGRSGADDPRQPGDAGARRAAPTRVGPRQAAARPVREVHGAPACTATSARRSSTASRPAASCWQRLAGDALADRPRRRCSRC